MNKDNLIASGNLATSRRTITGVLAQLALLAIDDSSAARIFTGAGLPSQALQQPDFPISLEQELLVCSTLANFLAQEQSPVVFFFSAMHKMGIENLGVLGMAMRHAATAVEALNICLTYPQLTWGHSHMAIRRQGDASLFYFSMERPVLRDAGDEDIDRLVEYCLSMDLLTSIRNIQDILESRESPLFIKLPFPRPGDWTKAEGTLPCPVHFSEGSACFAFPTPLDSTPLPHANPLLHRSYASIANSMSQMLSENCSLAERVTRWLWAYTPPPKRAEIAGLLAKSERSMTRQLGREGTSYSQLLAQVQQERAKNFLRNPALSVAEIGYRLGYSEPAAFSRAFTGWTGLAPLKWRKKKHTPG